MNIFVVLYRNGSPDRRRLEKSANRTNRVSLHRMPDQVRWVRSYTTNESTGSLVTVCIFQGTTAEAVREHPRRAGIPADEILPVDDTIVLEDDPPRTR